MSVSREEIATLMRGVYETTLAFDAAIASEVEEIRRTEAQHVAELGRIHGALVACEAAWPPEWAPAIAAWCASYVRMQKPPLDARELIHEDDRAVEELGLLVDIPGARELRERRAAERREHHVVHDERSAAAREKAVRIVAVLREHGPHRWTAPTEESRQARANLLDGARTLRLTYTAFAAQVPLAGSIVAVQVALIAFLKEAEDRTRAPALWDGVREAVDVLALAAGIDAPPGSPTRN